LHHDVAFDGADAPPPRSASLLQDCFKDLKLVRCHSNESKVPLHHLSAGCLEGSTFTAGYTKKFTNGATVTGFAHFNLKCLIDNLKWGDGAMCNRKKYLKLKIIRVFASIADWQLYVQDEWQLASRNRT